jgi:hypothetical protein
MPTTKPPRELKTGARAAEVISFFGKEAEEDLRLCIPLPPEECRACSEGQRLKDRVDAIEALASRARQEIDDGVIPAMEVPAVLEAIRVLARSIHLGTGVDGSEEPVTWAVHRHRA